MKLINELLEADLWLSIYISLMHPSIGTYETWTYSSICSINWAPVQCQPDIVRRAQMAQGLVWCPLFMSGGAQTGDPWKMNSVTISGQPAARCAGGLIQADSNSKAKVLSLELRGWARSVPCLDSADLGAQAWPWIHTAAPEDPDCGHFSCQGSLAPRAP